MQINFGYGGEVDHYMGVSLTDADGIAVVPFSNQPPADRRFVLLAVGFAKGGASFISDTSAFIFDSVSFFGPIIPFGITSGAGPRAVPVQPVGPWTFVRSGTINVQLSPTGLVVGGTLDIALYGKLVL